LSDLLYTKIVSEFVANLVILNCEPFFCKISFPNNVISEIFITKNFIQNLHPNISGYVPIAMQKYTSCRFQNAVHLFYSFFEPSNVMVNSAAPPVLKTPNFALIAPNYLVIAVAEEGRVKIDKVYRVAVYRF
jgi:hypothetical protein